MIAALICLIILCCLCVLLTAASCFIGYKAILKNFELQDKMKDYNRFFTLISEVLDEDTQFLRSELIKKLSMEMMETRELNSAILKFRTRLEAIKISLKEYKMME